MTEQRAVERRSFARQAWDRRRSRALELLDQGLSCPVVAARLGIPADTVRDWRQQLREQLAATVAATRRT